MTTTTTTDERGGLPSASSLTRMANCLGSYQAEKHAPQADTSSPEAETGNRIHAALAGDILTSTLTSEELETFEACEKLAVTLALETYGGLDHSDQLCIEDRFWLHNDAGERAISGKPDLVAVYGTRALLVDYKTGRNPVEHARENMQLRALTAILDHNLKLTEVTVAIVQPWAPNPDNRVTKCVYSAADIQEAKAELREILEQIASPNAPRTPGDHCTYCKAKQVCPEGREWAVTPPVLNAPVAITPDALAATLTNDTLAKFLERAQVAVKIIEACKDEAKRRIEAGDTLPGWKLKPGVTRETITDPQKVFDRFCDAGGTTDGFMSAVSITKGKLKDALKAATGAKGKALDSQLDALLAEAVRHTDTAPSLTRTNE